MDLIFSSAKTYIEYYFLNTLRKCVFWNSPPSFSSFWLFYIFWNLLWNGNIYDHLFWFVIECPICRQYVVRVVRTFKAWNAKKEGSKKITTLIFLLFILSLLCTNWWTKENFWRKLNWNNHQLYCYTLSKIRLMSTADLSNKEFFIIISVFL